MAGWSVVARCVACSIHHSTHASRESRTAQKVSGEVFLHPEVTTHRINCQNDDL